MKGFVFLQNAISTAQRRPPAFKSGRVCWRSRSDECQLWPLPASINALVVFGTGLRAQQLIGILQNCLSPEVKTGIFHDGVCDVGLVGAGKNRKTTSPTHPPTHPRVVYFNLQAMPLKPKTMEIQQWNEKRCQDVLEKGRAFTRDDERTESALLHCAHCVCPLCSNQTQGRVSGGDAQNVLWLHLREWGKKYWSNKAGD